MSAAAGRNRTSPRTRFPSPLFLSRMPNNEIPLAHVCSLPAGAAHLAKESCHPGDPLLDQPAEVRELRQVCRRQARPTAVLILWEAQILHQRDWGGKMRSCRQGKEMARSGGGAVAAPLVCVLLLHHHGRVLEKVPSPHAAPHHFLEWGRHLIFKSDSERDRPCSNLAAALANPPAAKPQV